MPIGTVIALYIGDKLLSQFLKEEGYGGLKKILFPTQKYRERLQIVIQESVAEYEFTCSEIEDKNKFPFYQSQILFELLNEHILFKKNKVSLVAEEFEKNVNVIRPTSEELQGFYDIFVKKVNGDNKLKKLFIEENYKAEIFKISDHLEQILEIENQILLKVVDIDHTMEGIGVQMNQLTNRFKESFNIQNKYNPQGILLEKTNIFSGTKRDKYISEIVEVFSSTNWIWLVGNVLIGKTSVASLIAERFKDKFWIDFTGIDPSDIMTVIILELSAHFNLSENIENLIRKLPHNSLLVLDDLPKLNLSTLEWIKLRKLIEYCSEFNIKVLSTCNFNVDQKLSDFISNGVLVEKSIPYLSEDDVIELLNFHGANDDALKVFFPLVHNISQGHPVLATAICQYLKTIGWNGDDNTIIELFSGNYQNSIDDFTLDKIISTVNEKDSRNLLYRLKIVIGKISTNEIDVLSSIKPQIQFPYEQVTKLSGPWLKKIKSNEYELSPLVKKIRSSTLSNKLFETLNIALGTEIVNRSEIDLISGRNAVFYFIEGKKFNEAGFLFSSMLQGCLDNPSLYFKWHFYRMWRSTKLPPQMDIFLKSFIRYIQISILKENEQEDIKFLIEDLEEIVLIAAKENVNVANSAFLLSTLLLHKDSGKSLKFLIIGLNHRDRLQEIYGKISLPNKIFSIEGLIWQNLLNISTKSDFETWVQSFESMSDVQKTASFIGQIHEACCFAFTNQLFNSKISNEYNNWNELVEILDYIVERVKNIDVGILVECCLRYKIKYLCVEKKNSDSAVEIVKEYFTCEVTDDRRRFIILNVLGRELFFQKEIERAFGYLKEASSISLTPLFTDKIETDLILSQIYSESDKYKAVIIARQAYDFQFQNEFVDDVFSAKVIGELAISEWEFKPTEKVFLLFEEAIEKILLSYMPVDQYKGTLIRLCHSLNYYYFTLAKKDLPLPDGEPYVVPMRGIFALSNEALLASDFYFEQRKFMAMYLLVQVFEQQNDLNKAKKWANKCLNYCDNGLINPFSILTSGMQAYMIIEDRSEDAVLQELDNLNKINQLMITDDLTVSLGNQRLVDVVARLKNQPFENNHDVYILSFYIPFIIMKGLLDFSKATDSTTIHSLISEINLLEKYFIDPYPLHIIGSAINMITDNNISAKNISEIDVKEGEYNWYFDNFCG